MFIKTLAARAANANKRHGGLSLGIIGLYNPNDKPSKTMKVLVCPEDETLEGNVYPIEASRSNQRNAIEYAKSTQSEVLTAIDRMDHACRMAKAKERDPAPQMLFYLPSCYFANNKLFVNFPGFSCRTPEFEGNNNIKFPVYDFAPVETFIINVATDVTTQKGDATYDSVIYFVSKKNPPIHEGFLNSKELGEILSKEAWKNPLMEMFSYECKDKDNSYIKNLSLTESIKYQICVRDHPEVCLYGNVCSLTDYQTGKEFRTPEEILERLRSDVNYVLTGNGIDTAGMSNDDLKNFIANKVFVRCVSGFRLRDALFDMTLKNKNYQNRRLFAPLSARCTELRCDDPENKNKENVTYTCMPPVKRVSIVNAANATIYEDKKHLCQVRNLSLLNPDGKEVSYPKGQGLVVLKCRAEKDNPDVFHHYITLEAGLLTHRATNLVTRFSFDDTKCDLSDQGILRENILPILMMDDTNEAMNKCYEIYNQMIESVDLDTVKEETVSDMPSEDSVVEEPGDDIAPSEEIGSSEEVPF